MQDGAPGHAPGDTRRKLAERGIFVIFLPAHSPDLKPIETVWNWMKDYIERVDGDVQLSYNQLRIAVREAWDAYAGTAPRADRFYAAALPGRY